MKNLTATICLAVALLLGSTGAGLACTILQNISPLDDFLRHNLSIKKSNYTPKNEITGYINIYIYNIDHKCTCIMRHFYWEDKINKDEKCLPPMVLLLENGGLVPLNNSLFDTASTIEKFYVENCDLAAFNQSLYGHLVSTIDLEKIDSIDLRLVERVSRRCKVKITGLFKNISLDETIWAALEEYPEWYDNRYLRYIDRHMSYILNLLSHETESLIRRWIGIDYTPVQSKLFERYFEAHDIKMIDSDVEIIKKIKECYASQITADVSAEDKCLARP